MNLTNQCGKPLSLQLRQPVPVQAGVGQRSPLTEVRLCTVGLPKTFPEPSAKVRCPACLIPLL